jgi:hypothetical protein
MEMWSHDGDQIEAGLASPAEGGTRMSEQATGTPRDLEAHLIARAWKDEAFRQELLSDPKAVVERELRRQHPDARLPEHVQLQVLEETPTTHYLVLPPKPTVESGEALSDTDLAQVAAAGGRLQSWAYTTPYPECCDTAMN